MADSNETIIRLLQILYSTDENHPMNARQIIEVMESKYQQRMSRDTVYSEIKTLKYCGFPIQSCKNKNLGYYMDRHEFEAWQLKIMIDSISQAKCLTWQESHDLRKKLLSMASPKGVKQITSIFTPMTRNKPIDKSTGPFIETILEAVEKGKRIEFQYIELDENMRRVLRKDGQFYEFSVFCMIWSNHTYYIIGGHEKRRGDQELTTYRLDRFESVRVSDKSMITCREFLGENPEQKLQKFIDEQVEHYSGKTVHFILEFEPTPRNMAILGDFAGFDVWISHLNESRVRVSMTKQDSPALHGWLLKYAKEFKIVFPPELREELLSQMEDALQIYRQE